MSVARMSCPEFLDAPLRPAQEPVDVEAIGVGRHLGGDPGDQTCECLGKRRAHAKPTLEGREAYLHLLADRRPPVSLFGRQQDARAGELFPQTAKEPHLAHAAPSKPVADCPTWRGCKTSRSVESTRRVSGSPTNSSRTARRKGSRKRRSLRRRRCKEEG